MHVECFQSYASISGSTATVYFYVTFKSPFNAARNIWVDAATVQGSTYTWTNGWLNMGYLNVLNGTAGQPEVLSVSSPYGASRQGDLQQFAVKLHDTSGALSIWHLEFMFSQGNSWNWGYNFAPSQRCKVVAETTANLVWMEDPTGSVNSMESPGYVSDGSSTTITSPLCSYYAQYAGGEQLDEFTAVIFFTVSFNNSFTNFMQEHTYVTDDTGYSGSNGWNGAWDNGSSTCTYLDSSLCPSPGWPHWYVVSGTSLPSPADMISCLSGNTSVPNCTANSYYLPALTDGDGNIIPYTASENYTMAVPSNFTITAQAGASIQRDPDSDPYDYSNPILQVPSTSSNVTISGLTILGNRYAIGTPGDPNNSGAKTLGYQCVNTKITYPIIDGKPTKMQVPACADVEIDGTSVTIKDNAVLNSGAYGIDMLSPASTVTVEYNEVDNSQLTGILTYGPGPGGDPTNPNNCSAGTSYGTTLPYNLTINYNNFFYNDGAAIVLSVNTANVSNNMMMDNQIVNLVDGGVIVDNACSIAETYSNNTINNQDQAYPGNKAMELYGINMTLQDNTIENFPGPGIYMNSTCGVAVFGGSITNVNRFQSGFDTYMNSAPEQVQTGGLYLVNQSTPAARDNQEVTVANLTATNNFSGIAFLPGGGPANGNFANVNLPYNCLTGNNSSGGAIYVVGGGSLPSGITTGSTNSCNGTLPSVPACSFIFNQ